MLILGSWAALNIISSPIGALNTEGSKSYFHQMNGYWNLVNLGLATAGYLSVSKMDPSALSLAESLGEYQSMQKILLFNAGLDLAYIAGGFYMMERSKNVSKRKDLLKGFGQSVILQGSFLFLFDTGFYLVLNSLNPEIQSLISALRISPQGLGLSFRF